MQRSQKSFKILPVILSLSFVCLIFSANVYAQQFNKIFEEPGGGGSVTPTYQDKNDDYTLYIIGGAVIAGIIIYAVLRDKKETKPVTDTSSVSSLPKLKNGLVLSNNRDEYPPELPVKVSLGAERNRIHLDDKRYFIGISVGF